MHRWYCIRPAHSYWLLYLYYKCHWWQMCWYLAIVYSNCRHQTDKPDDRWLITETAVMSLIALSRLCQNLWLNWSISHSLELIHFKSRLMSGKWVNIMGHLQRVSLMDCLFNSRTNETCQWELFMLCRFFQKYYWRVLKPVHANC